MSLSRAFLLAALLFPFACWAQTPWYPAQPVTWQNARSPYTPGSGAVMGGPGSDPDPGSPMYICRAMFHGSMTPGKWVKGNCNISYGGHEYVRRSYQVAYGNVYWGQYQGSNYGLVQTGTEADGTPLYSCRVHYIGPPVAQSGGGFPGFPGGRPAGNPGGNAPAPPAPPSFPQPSVPAPPSVPRPNVPAMPWAGLAAGNSFQGGSQAGDTGYGIDYGYQPGKIVGGNCDFPFAGREIVQPPPFEALFAAGYPQYPPYPPYPPQTGQPAPPSYAPQGPSSVTWQHEQAPFTPSAGAIMGGPGDGPKPGAPLYVCRGGYSGALLPGKWIGGKCSIPVGNREMKVNTYDVAYGSGSWAPYSGPGGDLAAGGYDSSGNPVYICRVPHFSFWTKDRGSQPGSLIGGQCVVPYGGSALAINAPFEALYNAEPASDAAPGTGEPAAPTAGPAQGSAVSGVEVVFQSGTASASGRVAIMNGSNGRAVTETLAPNLDLASCVAVLQKAALEAGLQIQAVDGGLKIFGSNNSVNVTGASVSVHPF